MKTLNLVLGVGIGCLLCAYAVHRANLSNEAQQEQRIARWIEDLGDEQFEVRERATQDLIAAGPVAYEAVRQVRASTQDPEVRQRAEQILSELAVLMPGGEAVDGLKICMSADKKSYRPGDTVELSVTLCNLTDNDLNVQIGSAFQSNWFTTVAGLHATNQATRKEQPAEIFLYMCGSPAPLYYATLPPGKTLDSTIKTVLTKHDESRYALRSQQHILLLDCSADNRFSLRLDHTTTPVMHQTEAPNRPILGVKNRDATFWCGTVRSNEIAFSIQTP